jgi:TRAP-type mannitol/chloroaromatic compound transport system substrate-binding protein
VAGAILRPFPQDVLEACYKAANEIYDDLVKSNPHFKKMYESLSAFRNESLCLESGRRARLRQLHDAHAHQT